MPERDDRVVLVTGGARGIGRAAVLAFAAQGCRVVFCYHSSRAAADELAAAADQAGQLVTPYSCDVTDSEAVSALVDFVLQRHGRLDVLVNNAGSFPRGPVTTITNAEWERALAVNLSAVFYCCRAAIPAMQRGGGGAIINLASIAGKRGSAWHSAYAAAKGGVLAFTRSLAREVIQDNIRVNAVCPGRIATDLLLGEAGPGEQARWQADTPIRRLGTADEVAQAIVFLASPAAAYIVGETLDVDGGLLMD
jgi:3-oxoacyl-[acyl-carrier protein] reductase